MRIPAFLTLVLSFSCPASAQTVIQAVTDAASYAPRVAPGALATIFGQNLANGTAQATSFPLPRSLANTTVYINRAAVPLLYVSQTQINFQVPSGLAPGTASLYVTPDGGNSLPFQFTVASSAPGIFQDANHHAVAQNASAGYSTNSSSNPAASGSIVVVYLSGQGAVDHPVPDGAATPASPRATAKAPATATIGGVNTTVNFLGLTPGYAGFGQANIVVPNLPTGDYPLVIQAGAYGSSSAMLSVSGSGTPPPKFLTLLGRVNFANDATSSVVVYGPTTYVCGVNRISIIDTSNASAPKYLGEFGDADLAGNGGPCALNTSTARPILVDTVGPGSAPSFAIYDLSVPTQPVKLYLQPLATYTFLENLSFLGTTGFTSTDWFTYDGRNYVTAQHGDLLAYDFSSLFPAPLAAMVPNPGQPASNNLNIRPRVLALPLSSNYPPTVYSASTTATGGNTNGNAALDVIDVSSIQAMQGVNRVTVSKAAVFMGFAYDHVLLLVTGNTQGLRNPGVPDFNIAGNLTVTTMDITNVQSPFEITTLVTGVPTTGTFRVQPFGSNVFAIGNNPPATDSAGPGSLMIVDARKPSAPSLYPVLTQFGVSGMQSVFTQNATYLLVADLYGMSIYGIQIP